MSLSNSISEKFQSQAIKYQTIELTQPCNIQEVARYLGDDVSKLLRCVGVRTEGKSVVVILPYLSMLDMKKIAIHMLTSCSAMSASDTQALFTKNKTPSCPPIIDLITVDVVVDASVLDMPEVIIETGDPQTLFKLDKTGVDELYAGANAHSVAVDAEDLCAGREESTQVALSFTPTRLKQRVDDTFDLPAMPDIAQDIMKLRIDPSADASKLANIVLRDPSIAAQVISWATSPYYGYQGKVDSVETAIARVLGFELVMNLALGISIGKSLKIPSDGPLGIREFWKQAIYSATLCEKLCRAMPVKQRPERGLIYLSGLLHNFGHLLLGHIFPPQFALINDTIIANPHIAVEDIEFHILGVTHEEIGAWLMQNWHMPEELIVAVHHHHEEDFWSQHAVYSNTVLVANRLLKRLDIGDMVQTAIPASTLEMLSIDQAAAEEALNDIELESETLDIMAKQLVA